MNKREWLEQHPVDKYFCMLSTTTVAEKRKSHLKPVFTLLTVIVELCMGGGYTCVLQRAFSHRLFLADGLVSVIY